MVIINKVVNNNVRVSVINIVDYPTLGAGNIQQRRAIVAGFIHDMG